MPPDYQVNAFTVLCLERGMLMGTAIVGTIVLLAVAAAIKSIINNKKNGKACCGGDCSRCKGCH